MFWVIIFLTKWIIHIFILSNTTNTFIVAIMFPRWFKSNIEDVYCWNLGFVFGNYVSKIKRTTFICKSMMKKVFQNKSKKNSLNGPLAVIALTASMSQYVQTLFYFLTILMQLEYSNSTSWHCLVVDPIINDDTKKIPSNKQIHLL